MLFGSYLMADEASSEEEKRLDHGVKALLSGQIDFPLFLEIQIQSFFFHSSSNLGSDQWFVVVCVDRG